MRSRNFCAGCAIILNLIIVSSVHANNLSISNVAIDKQNAGAKSIVIKFDVSWENSWRTKINHDAVWVTIRLHDPSVSPAYKKLCQMTASGTNPAGTSVGTNPGLEVYVPGDMAGAFLRPASYGVNSGVASTSAQLTIDYSSCGFSDSSNVYASVFGLEMVYIPQGSFYAGDYGTSAASLVEGSSDTDPWTIGSEGAVNVTNSASNGFRYVSNANADEYGTGASFTIPAAFPKGFGPFYVMKYEVTEGQWVEFINSLPSSAARSSHDLTDSGHKNSDAVKYRNTVSCSGSPLTCSSGRPARALNYLSWMDLAAFLDWTALRPLTELEFEKAARGPILPAAGEFAWGTTDIAAAAVISGTSEDGSETATNTAANAHYSNTVLTGGDTANGNGYNQGPLRAGIFAKGSTTRVTAGGSYYGVMELSGNLRERVVTIGNAAGLVFAGTHGNGYLTTASGGEGNADNADWPGIDANPPKGVTGAAGSGFRGGAWDDQLSGARLRISDRFDAAGAATTATQNMGGRGARTAN